MKKWTLITLVLISGLTAIAQTNVRIVGKAENAPGKTISLYCYEDMLTRCEQLLDNAVIDSATGSFELGCYANYPRLVFVQVENYSQSFYIEPGRKYEVLISEFNWDIDEEKNIFLDPVVLPLQFINLPADELNLRISRFEHITDSFIVANKVHFDPKFRPQKRYFDTLKMIVRQQMPDTSNAFFNRYRDYTLAEMQLTMRFISRKKLISRYIDGQPVRYYDEQYMRLFLALYDHSISKGMMRVPVERLVSWVEHEDIRTYLDSLGTDPLLRNEQIRELATIQALKESYYINYYDRRHVRHMMQLIEKNSKFKEHRELARRVLGLFERGERGSEALEFTLPDIDHNPVSLSDFKGKWVYLSFVRVGDPNSLRELETMAYFRDTIYAQNENVRFVTVSCDREFQKMYHLLKNNRRGHRYNWTWLHFNGNYKLLEHYGVVNYPTFVLIAPDGKLQYDMTPPPASGFLMQGPWIQKKENNQENKHFWQY